MSLQRVAFSPLHTFTRATNETFFNQVVDSFGNVSYQLQTAPSGTAVQNAYNPATGEPLGLQVFEQRTNQFPNALQPHLVLGTSAINDALGAETEYGVGNYADLIPQDDGNTTVNRFSIWSVTPTWLTVGSFATAQMLIKKGSVSDVVINSDTGYFGGVTTLMILDLDTGEVSSVLGFTNIKTRVIADGVVDISFTYPVATSSSGGTTLIRTRPQAPVFGDGVTVMYSVGLIDVQVGAFETPRILTSGTSATRNASVAVINDIDESEWFNQSEGTFVVEFEKPPTGLAVAVFMTSNNTDSQRLQVSVNTSSVVVFVVGATAFNTGISVSAFDKIKLSYSFNASGVKASVNGSAIAQTSLIADTLLHTTAHIGSRRGIAEFLNSHIGKIIYYPTAVSDAKLQELSTL